MNTKEIKEQLASEFFGNRCAVCHKPYKPNEKWVIHHLWYEDYQKKWKDFKKKNSYDQDAYHQDLQKQVRRNPKQFVLIHNSHHAFIHKLAHWKKENRARILDIVGRMDR